MPSDNRNAPAYARTRTGWFSRLSSALVRWFSHTLRISGSTKRREVTARPTAFGDASSSATQSRAAPAGRDADVTARSDKPPPTIESSELEPTGRHSQNESSESAAPKRLRGFVEAPSDFVPAKDSANSPAAPVRGEAPSSPSGLPEPPDHTPEHDPEIRESRATTAEAPPVSEPASGAIRPEEPCADPGGGQPSPIKIDYDGDVASQIPRDKDDVGAFATSTTIYPTGDADPASSVDFSNSGVTERSRGQDRLSERQQDQQPIDTERNIQRYRPRLRSRRTPATTTATAASSKPSPPQTGPLEAALLLTFLPGEWGISLSVLLSRADGMPECLDVRVGDERLSLYAIEEKLFEPIQPSNTDFVGMGFSAEVDGEPIRRWVRTPRDLHAFSHRPGVSGFASVPRVLIGQENVVLCKTELAAVVQKCASATGSDPPVEVGGPGVPDGWQCLRGYRPRQPADFGEVEDIFLALNPLPDAALELTGGIDTDRRKWVIGAPPLIRALGVPPGPGDLTIDGIEATQSPDEGWTAPGWDSLGTHTIRLAGLSRTYEIARIDEAWPSWTTAEDTAFSACGARVSAADGRRALAIQGGPFWLVGAVAGDLEFAQRTANGFSIAAPPFRPVWAVSPVGPGRRPPARMLPHRSRPRLPAALRSGAEVLHWCSLLRGTRAPLDPDEKDLWRQYRKLARSLRRKWR